MVLTRFILTLIFCLVPIMGNAATLYVNNSGSPSCSDATTKASNNASSPWCTILRAVRGSTSYVSPVTGEAAAAGDTVLITAGIYSENGRTAAQGGWKFSVSLNAVNSGTAGNLITFRGVGNVYVRMNDTMRGGMIGCDGVSYIVWDHVIIDDYYGGSTSDTGPVVFASNDHCQLINSEVIAHTGSYFWGYPIFDANYRGISLEPDANFNTIKNNRIHGFTGDAAGIVAYDSNDNIVEHNEVYANKIGIYFKGLHATKTMDRNIIRYNYVHDNTHRGIQLESATDSQIYQNIITQLAPNGLACIFLGTLGGPHNTWVVNNTCYTTNTLSEAGLMLSGITSTNVEAKNNIFYGVAAAFNYPIYDAGNGFNVVTQGHVLDRNLWYGYGALWHVENLGIKESFATWQGSPEFQEANSLNSSDPLFINNTSDYHLQVGSPALTLGRVVHSIGGTNGTTIPVGAYITGLEEIGIEVGGGGGGGSCKGYRLLLGVGGC